MLKSSDSPVKLISNPDVKQKDIDRAYNAELENVKKQSLNLGGFALLMYPDIGSLEGKILTIVDASISDPNQRKAIKDLVRRSIWHDWVNTLEVCEKNLPIGVPTENWN